MAIPHEAEVDEEHDDGEDSEDECHNLHQGLGISSERVTCGTHLSPTILTLTLTLTLTLNSNPDINPNPSALNPNPNPNPKPTLTGTCLYVPGASDGEEPQRHGEERDNRVPVCQVWVKNAMIAYLMIHGHVRSWPESQECNRGTAQSGSHKEMQ